MVVFVLKSLGLEVVLAPSQARVTLCVSVLPDSREYTVRLLCRRLRSLLRFRLHSLSPLLRRILPLPRVHVSMGVPVSMILAWSLGLVQARDNSLVIVLLGLMALFVSFQSQLPRSVPVRLHRVRPCLLPQPVSYTHLTLPTIYSV